MATNALWRPDDVVARAKELIHSSNYERVGEARKAVDDTLAQWVGDVLAQRQQPGAAAAASAAASAALVAQLWGAYAALEVELRQFKQATKVFESAVSCPVAGGSAALWLQYAAFCVERKKFSNARKIFVRALHAVAAAADHDALWAAFHAFVVAHVEPAMTLATLKAQVAVPPVSAGAAGASAPPAPAPVPAAGPAAAPSAQSTSPQTAPQPPAAAAPPPPQQQPQPPVNAAAASPPVAAAPTAQQQQQPPPVADAVAATATATATVAAEPALALDPALAFVDKTGKTEPPAEPNAGSAGSKKRGAADAPPDDASKRAKVDALAPPKLEIADTLYFRHIPTALPVVAACPHLLFDAVREGESQSEMGEELLERLSDALRDTAVFQGVKDLCANQRQRDRETLYRWQDLVGMQMKEGSELFARHSAAELKHAADPRELIALKTQHLEQRREFITRCQMSQQQFIEITGLDRVNALKAQQISLTNMKIPEMTVTTDSEAIGLQRAVLVLVQETEKLYREEMKKISAATAASASPAKATPAKKASPELTGSSGPSHGSRGATSHYPKQQGGFRASRGGHGSRGSMDRQSNSRASAGYANRGAPPRRDFDSPYSQPAAASHTGFDNHGPRQQQQQQQQQQLHVRPTVYQGQQQQRAPSSYNDRVVTQDYSSSDYPPPPHQQQLEPARGRYSGPSYGSDGGDPAWELPQQPRYSQSRGNDYGSRYGGGGGSSPVSLAGSAALVSSYSNGPKQSRGRAYGAGDGGMAPPQQQQYGGGYSAFSSGPQQHHQQQRGTGGVVGYQPQSPPYSGYQSDDYAAPPQSNFSSYSNRNPAPYQQQQQHQGPPPQQQQYHQFQQRGGRSGGGGFGNQQQQQQQQPLHAHLGHQQAQGYSRGGGGFRRGGGGGRFGRR